MCAADRRGRRAARPRPRGLRHARARSRLTAALISASWVNARGSSPAAHRLLPCAGPRRPPTPVEVLSMSSRHGDPPAGDVCAPPAAPATRWLTQEEMAAWLPLLRLVELLPQALDRQLRKEAGIRHAYYQVMVHLSAQSDRTLTMGELARLAATSPSRLSHAFAAMEAHGWVTRRPCGTDRRVQYACLTEAGIGAAGPHRAGSRRRRAPARLRPAHRGRGRAIALACGQAPAVARGLRPPVVRPRHLGERRVARGPAPAGRRAGRPRGGEGVTDAVRAVTSCRKHLPRQALLGTLLLD